MPINKPYLSEHFLGHCRDCTPRSGFRAEEVLTTPLIASGDEAEIPALSALLEDSSAANMQADFEGLIIAPLPPQ